MSRDIFIAPSILSADFSKLGEAVKTLDQAGADWIHVDVMDGHFVPNITFGPKAIKDLRPHTRLPLDVHLMMAPVDPYIKTFAEAGADWITIHPEAGPHPHRTVQHIKSLGKKAGISLNPGTPVSILEPLLPLIDLVLVMTVNPGFGGQSFISAQLEKIQACRKIIDQSGRDILLEVDGGITPETARQAIEAGADVLVAGTSVFKSPQYAENIKALRG